MSGSPPPEPPPKGYAEALHEMNIAIERLERVRAYLEKELRESRRGKTD